MNEDPSTSSNLPPPAPASSLEEWLNINPTSSYSNNASSLTRTLDPKTYVEDFWQQKTRPDGRLFAQGRPTKVVYGMLKHSAGSALVSSSSLSTTTTGSSSSTKILAATTLQIGQPEPEQPDVGEVIVQVSGTGGKNVGSDLRSQQQTQWDVLQSWLQRILEEDDIPSQLNLITGRACIRLVVTVLIIEDGGNLKDACLLACMSAWKDTRLPIIGQDLLEVQGKFWWKEGKSITSQQQEYRRTTATKDENTPRHYRISLSMGVWVHPADKTTHLLVDLSSEEEDYVDGVLTVVMNMSTGQLQVQYAGKTALTATELALASKMAKGRAQELESIFIPE
jgi:exosome complex RNA-binding protein Rrp42 (RNase PH superfamily)